LLADAGVIFVTNFIWLIITDEISFFKKLTFDGTEIMMGLEWLLKLTKIYR
jgi:hypothetical protein